MNARNLWSVVKVLLSITALAVPTYLQHPLFGQLPSEKQLLRIEHSKSYAGGAFQNQLATPLLGERSGYHTSGCGKHPEAGAVTDPVARIHLMAERFPRRMLRHDQA